MDESATLNEILSRLVKMEQRIELMHEDIRRTGESASRAQIHLEKLLKLQSASAPEAQTGAND